MDTMALRREADRQRLLALFLGETSDRVDASL
jgi:hypothetical protein